MEIEPIGEARDGGETHPSWLLVRANRVSSSPPGQILFDSDIPHQHFIRVTIVSATRRRGLNRDWLTSEKVLMEFDLSQAQWGAFVSSFGDGTGVPATLSWANPSHIPAGDVPSFPFESRLNASHKEVREAGTTALAGVQEAHAAVQEAFDNNLGKKVMRERLRALQIQLNNAPANMEFAAESLTEHVENVVTKARADIEGMIQQGGMSPAEILEAESLREIESGDA